MKRTHTLPSAQLRPSEATNALIQQRRRFKKPHVATGIRVSNATTKATYNGAEVCMPALRKGADDALQVPSRVGDFLHYRDGRVVPFPPQFSQPIHSQEAP